MKRLALLALVAFVAVVVPVAAKDRPTPHKPTHHKRAAHKAAPHKCTPHRVAYGVSGTLLEGSLTKNSDGTYSGDLTVHVVKANRHARDDKGTDKSYALDHAKVKLHDEDPAALTPGSRVKLNGKVTKLAKKCDQAAFTPEVTIRKANIKPPKATPEHPKDA